MIIKHVTGDGEISEDNSTDTTIAVWLKQDSTQIDDNGNINDSFIDQLKQTNTGFGFFKRGKDSNAMPNVTTSVWNDRFFWSDFEPSDGVYQLPSHDMFKQATQAISFGIRCFIERDQVRRFPESIPHKRLATGEHVPLWDSPVFHERLRTLLTNVRALLGTRPIAWIEIRIFGTFGEWHQHGLVDAPTISFESQTKIVDAHIDAFGDRCQLLQMGDAYDMIIYANNSMSLHENPYNQHVGYRLDSLGHPRFDAIMQTAQWQYISRLANEAPVVTEVYGALDEAAIIRLPMQIAQQRVINVGNGNIKQSWLSVSPYLSALWSSIPTLTAQATYPVEINLRLSNNILTLATFANKLRADRAKAPLHANYEIVNPANGRSVNVGCYVDNVVSVDIVGQLGIKHPVIQTNTATVELEIHASYGLYMYSLPIYSYSLTIQFGLDEDEATTVALDYKVEAQRLVSELAQKQFQLQATLDRVSDAASQFQRTISTILYESLDGVL